MKKLLIAILVAVATIAPAGAQTVKVSGTVRDARTGEALPLVNVGLMRPADTVFVRGNSTDFEGRFAIADVMPDGVKKKSATRTATSPTGSTGARANTAGTGRPSCSASRSRQSRSTGARAGARSAKTT